MLRESKHIAALIDSGGDITLGHLADIGKCVARPPTVAVPGDGRAPKGRESRHLLQRLDAAVADAYENEHFADEINFPLLPAHQSHDVGSKPRSAFHPPADC